MYTNIPQNERLLLICKLRDIRLAEFIKPTKERRLVKTVRKPKAKKQDIVLPQEFSDIDPEVLAKLLRRLKIHA